MQQQTKLAGAEAILQETVYGIESAKSDLNVFEAMKKGD